MSYEENDGKAVFPTRKGAPQGTAAERKMLDVVGGAQGIRKRVSTNDDGTTTRLTTRAGFPEFVSESGKGKSCWEFSTVLNHGFIDTTYNFAGVGDNSSEPIRSLIKRDGSIPADKEVFIRNSHAWKAAFLAGEDWMSESSYGGLPSNFSGSMRRLMQVYHGTIKSKKKRQYQVGDNETCPRPPSKQPFSCTYEKTHGVYFSASGKRWIIEISSAGVFRIEAFFVREFSSSDFSSEETDETVAAEYWTPTSIKWAEKVSIGDAPNSYSAGFAPWYSWCGWAFNRLGSAATNVVFRDHPSLDNWMQAAMYDIAISSAGDIPSYAICTVTEIRNLASPVRDTHDGDTANIQAPLDLPGICYTKQIYAYGASGVDSPVYSFYEGSVKRVYRFVVYPVESADSTPISTDGNPQSFSISKQGDMTGFTDYDPGLLETQDTGVRIENNTGTKGGGVGGVGEGFPGQNTDIDVIATTVEHELGPSGFSIDYPSGGMSGSPIGTPPAFHKTLVTSVFISADGLSTTTSTQVVNTPDLTGMPLNYVYLCAAQARYTVSSTEHSKQSAHKSTIVISGYDRESISLAVSTDAATGSYTRSGTWVGDYRNVVVRGPMQWGGPGYPSPVHVLAVGGPDTKRLSGTTQNVDGGGYVILEEHPGEVIGCYDGSGVIGAVCRLSGTIRAIDGTPITVPDFYDVTPAKSSSSALLFTRVGGTTQVSSLGGNKIHTAKPAESVFSFYVGASAFSFGGSAYFFSKDADEKPTIVGLGSRTVAHGKLFGFVGAF